MVAVEANENYQNEQEARTMDAELVAQQSGLHIDDVTAALAFQDAFSIYAEELMDRFPDQISAVWVEQVPGTKGFIRFVGTIPAGVPPRTTASKLLTADNVVIVGDGRLSMDDRTRQAVLRGTGPFVMPQ